jgi:uncharacterized protein
MFLDLSTMREAVERLDRTFPVSAFPAGVEEYDVVEPVHLHLEVRQDKKRVHVAGEARTTLRLSCGRCLEDFLVPVAPTFDLIYLPQERNAGEGEIEIGEDDLATAFYQDERIDLAHLLREQFYLALPMKPLCDAACQGLCPECGTNLNRGTCTCNPRWDDPRLEGLKALLKKDQS